MLLIIRLHVYETHAAEERGRRIEGEREGERGSKREREGEEGNKIWI